MSEAWKRTFMIAGMAVFIVIPVLISYHIGQRRGIREALQDFRPDTLVIYHRDTISVSKPIYLTKTIVDTMRIPVPSVQSVQDSTGNGQSGQIALPREQVFYRDSTYEAWVSGYSPALDSITLFRQERTIYVDRIHEVKTKPSWSIGIQAGYGAFLQGQKVSLAPFVGIGIQYNFLSW